MTRAVRRGLAMLAMLALGIIALRYALRDFAWNDFVVQVETLHWGWLTLSAIFAVLSYVAQGARWKLLLEGATIAQTTRAIYAGLFLNELLPFRPGEAVRIWLASRDLGQSAWTVTSSVVVERLMDGLMLALGSVVLLLLAPLSPDLARDARWLVEFVAALMVLAAVLGHTRFKFLRQLYTGLQNIPALLFSFVFLLAQGLAFWGAFQASNLSLSPGACFVVMMIVRIGTLIPAAPANLGTHQLATVLALSLYGVPHAQAAAVSIILFTVLTLPLLVLGFFACLSAGLTWSGLRTIRHSDAAPDGMVVSPSS